MRIDVAKGLCGQLQRVLLELRKHDVQEVMRINIHETSRGERADVQMHAPEFFRAFAAARCRIDWAWGCSVSPPSDMITVTAPLRQVDVFTLVRAEDFQRYGIPSRPLPEGAEEETPQLGRELLALPAR